MMKLSLLTRSLLAVCITILAGISISHGGIVQTSNTSHVVAPSHLSTLTQGDSDTLVVINFWATWCAPCVKELPYFERLTSQDFGVPVKVVLVSMDFVEDQRKVNGFMKKKNISSTVLIPDVKDYNSFINDISKEWSGALPATMLYQGSTNKLQFYEREFKEKDLHDAITSFLQ